MNTTTQTTAPAASTDAPPPGGPIRLATTFVYTHDAEASLRFYRDVLGFPVETDVTNQGFRWLSLSVPSQPGLELTIQTVEASCPQDDSRVAGRSDQEAMGDLLAKGLLGPLIFSCDDVDALFEHVRAAGAEVLAEPADQFYGVRDCAFRDPSGTMLRFNQPLPR